jgi:hypothetical protein
MSLEATIFTHSGITSNFIKIAEFMHSRYTDYLISGLKGDSKISDIVDGWKQAEQIFENVESADNIVSEISKFLGGEKTIRNKETSGNTDSFDKKGLLENDSIDNTNLLDEILNVKNERLSFASDDDERKTTKTTDETLDLLYNYDSKKPKLSTNTDNKRVTPLSSAPGSSINNLPAFSTFPTPSTPSNHQNYQYQTPLNHQAPLNPQNQNDTSSQDYDNFTKINSILNRPSLLYVNSENYSQRLHEPHTKSKQHLLPDKLVDQFGIPTGQIRGKYKGQIEVSSTSLIYDRQEFTMDGDNKLQCDWEGCNFSTPRRTALKRHIQCIHMDVRNYKCEWNGCTKKFNRKDSLKVHMNSCKNKFRKREKTKFDEKDDTVTSEILKSDNM